MRIEERRPHFLPKLPTPQLLLASTQAVSTSHPVPHFPFPLPQLQTSPEKQQEENISQALHPQLSPKHGEGWCLEALRKCWLGICSQIFLVRISCVLSQTLEEETEDIGLSICCVLC